MSAPAASPGPGSTVHSDGRVQRVVGNRALVEQAKGVLIHRLHVGADQAFALLRRWAHETGSTVPVVAETLVHAVCLGDDTVVRDRGVRDHLAAALEERPGDEPAQRRHVPRPRQGAEGRGSAPLELRIRYAPSLPILRLGGDLAAPSVRHVRDALGSIAAAAFPATLVVLDLEGLTSCDVAALAGLEEAAAQLAAAGQELVLHGVSEELERLITQSGVGTALERH